MCGRPARAPHRCTPLAPPRGRRGGRGGASPVGAPTRPLPRVAVLSVKASGRDGGRGLAQVGTREGVEAGGSAWHPSPDKIRGNDQDRCLWKDLSARRQCTHPQPDWQPPRLSINPQRQGKTRQCQRATSSTIGAPTIAVVTRHCRAPPPACSGGRLAAAPPPSPSHSSWLHRSPGLLPPPPPPTLPFPVMCAQRGCGLLASGGSCLPRPPSPPPDTLHRGGRIAVHAGPCARSGGFQMRVAVGGGGAPTVGAERLACLPPPPPHGTRHGAPAAAPAASGCAAALRCCRAG